jgi:hypothetical protein
LIIVEDDTNFAKIFIKFYTRKSGYKGVVTVRGDFAINDGLVVQSGILLDIQLPVKMVVSYGKNSKATGKQNTFNFTHYVIIK